MSAPAIKSSLPGVGASIQPPPPPVPSHSILPMNMMAQKVLTSGTIGSDPNPMKPLSGTNLSYVTLQPANQPLSLVQEHRATFQMAPVSQLTKKEPEAVATVLNGMDKIPAGEEEDSASKKSTESNQAQNNNTTPENLKESVVPEVNASSTEIKVVVSHPTPQNKVEEKKMVTLNNGSKEHDAVPQNKPNQEEPEQETKKIDPPALRQTPKPAENAIPVPNNALKQENKIPAPVSRVSKRKPRELKELKELKGFLVGSGNDGKPKRSRTRTQPYQSPLPDIVSIVKTLTKAPVSKVTDDKLIVFYKNEFLAVRNAEGSFYVCQAMQNVHKSSRRIRIRWLSQDKNNGEIYSPDFYDFTDFDCILTNLNLNKMDKHKYQLTKSELLRTENILKRAIDVEAGVSEKPRVTEEHPDGLDLSLYKDESQLKRRKGGKQKQRKKTSRLSTTSENNTEEETDGETPKKRLKMGKVFSESARKGTKSRAERAMSRGARTTPATPVKAPAQNDDRNNEKKKSESRRGTTTKQLQEKQNSTPSVPAKASKGRGTATGRPKRSNTMVSTSGITLSRNKPRSRA